MRAGFSLKAGYWICDRGTGVGSGATLHHIELQSYLLLLEGGKKAKGSHKEEGGNKPRCVKQLISFN
jgi:hypothetical protein